MIPKRGCLDGDGKVSKLDRTDGWQNRDLFLEYRRSDVVFRKTFYEGERDLKH